MAISEHWLRVLAATIAGILVCAIQVDAACPQTSGKLRGLEHEVAGSISISSDCRIKATDFSYDGEAPAVYWWGAPTCNPAAIKKSGARISDDQIDKAYKNEEVTAALRTDIDWKTIGCIIVYCEEFFADLGDVKVGPFMDLPQSPPSSKTPVPTISPPSPSTYESLDELSSCRELIPGYYNLHWMTDGDSIILGFEGRGGGDGQWIGFGYSSPEATGPTMIDSHVVIVGMIGGECFAYNYYLSAKSQCNFEDASGVCPDFAGTLPLVPKTSAELLSCEKIGDKLNVIVKRPLRGDSDGDGSRRANNNTLNTNVNQPWPLNGTQFSVYAMGPVSEGSNATIPVVLYHNLQLPGTPGPTSVTSNPSNPIKLDLSIRGDKNCREIVPMVVSSSTTSSPSDNPESSSLRQVATIPSPPNNTLNITSGSNKNYPNPPAWGISLWVNGQESPVMLVKRGEAYTISAQAGPTHPVYITSSIIGGGSLVDFQDEAIFAGNDTTFGTPEQPTTFIWTPDKDTPDVVYYQCAVHQKLGWEIRVFNAGDEYDAAVAAATGPAATGPAAGPQLGSSSSPVCFVAIGQGSASAAAILKYDECFLVEGVGSNYHVAWSMTDDPNDATQSLLQIALNSTTNNGYVALGFPQSPGQMIGSSAMILKTCSACPSGADIAQFHLGGYIRGEVTPGGVLDPTDLQASYVDGVLAGKFTVKVRKVSESNVMDSERTMTAVVPGRKLSSEDRETPLDAPLSSFPLIFSSGTLASSGDIQKHATTGTSFVDFTVTATSSKNGGGATAGVISSSSRSINYTARTAHMWLMPIGFGVFIPVGILIAKVWPPPVNSKGFKAHRAMQTLGFLTGCGGLAAGFVAAGGWTSTYSVHRDIGVTVIVLSFVQILALVWRPAVGDPKLRRPWVKAHQFLGYSTAGLAISNIYYGIIHVAELGTWAWATYTAILGVIVILAVFNGCAPALGMGVNISKKSDNLRKNSKSDKDFVTKTDGMLKEANGHV